MSRSLCWRVRLGVRGVVRVSDGAIRKSDGGFLQALHCDHSAISNHSAAITVFAIECLRRPNQQELITVGQNWVEGVDRMM